MRLTLPTDLKTRTGAPDKDARMLNCYVETKGEQSLIRKRTGTKLGKVTTVGVAQGGIGFTLNGTDYVYTVNGDVGTLNTLETSGLLLRYAVGLSNSIGVLNNIGNGTRVIIPTIDGFQYSLDGINWTMVENIYAQYLRSMCIHGVSFIGLTYEFPSNNRIVYSSNYGLTWAEAATSFRFPIVSLASNGTNIVGVSFNDGVLGNQTKAIAYSTDGGATFASALNLPVNLNWVCVASDGTMFVATSANTTTGAAYSNDGITWTSMTMPSARIWYAVSHNGTKWCAVAQNASFSATSNDGISWTQHTTGISGNVNSMTVVNGTFVAIGSNFVMKSTDGITWTQIIIDNGTWYGVAPLTNHVVLAEFGTTDIAVVTIE